MVKIDFRKSLCIWNTQNISTELNMSIKKVKIIWKRPLTACVFWQKETMVDCSSCLRYRMPLNIKQNFRGRRLFGGGWEEKQPDKYMLNLLLLKQENNNFVYLKSTIMTVVKVADRMIKQASYFSQVCFSGSPRKTQWAQRRLCSQCRRSFHVLDLALLLPWHQM